MADWVTEETKESVYSDIEGLKPWIIRDLKRLDIVRPTPVQLACIPPAVRGQDVIGGAKTGSGKTLAFVLPILNKLSDDPYGIFCLVLTPTRELAFQISDQFLAVGCSLGVKVSVIVGGLDRTNQCRELKAEPHIVVSTPGRLYDLLNSSPEFTLKKIQFLVLDEADRLLDGRFNSQLSVVFAALPSKRQTLLFSATITDQIQEMKSLARQEVFEWQSNEGKQKTVDQLKEYYIIVNEAVRNATLVAFLLLWREENPNQLAIVFMDRRLDAEALALTLHELGLPCVLMHSFMSQPARLKSLARFKAAQSKLLIATDLASRGLDIPLVGLVVNHRMPNDSSRYIHRVGRTARAGRPGTALTLIGPSDTSLVVALEAVNPNKLCEYKQVDGELIRKIQKEVAVTFRSHELRLLSTGFEEKQIINKRKELIMQGLDPDEEMANLQRRRQHGQEKRRKRFLRDHGEAVAAGGKTARADKTSANTEATRDGKVSSSGEETVRAGTEKVTSLKTKNSTRKHLSSNQQKRSSNIKKRKAEEQ